MRFRLFSTLLVTLLAVALLAFPATMMNRAQHTAQQNDPSLTIEPMFALLEDNPQNAGIPVNPLLDVEECWAIEDTRSYSDSPMVRAMRNGNSALGFDAASRTFYCTLGLDTQDVWPTLLLYADTAIPSPASLQIAWVDDYTYDACSDAIREGYRYELIAYTDQSYEYFGIVFTGLPIVSIHTQEDTVIHDDYAPARICVSSCDHDAIVSAAQIHLRGGVPQQSIPKKSFRFELHDLSGNTDQKRFEGLLGMDPDSDWLLIANSSDPTSVRNSLCFDLWRRWNENGLAANMLQDQLVEVFVQDEYMGLYQLLQRIQPEKELLRIGGNPLTDSAVRLVIGTNAGEKPTLNIKESANMWVEYRYDGQNQPLRAFHRFMDFAQLSLREGKSLDRGGYLNDDEFCALVQDCLPVSPMMEYFLFHRFAILLQTMSTTISISGFWSRTMAMSISSHRGIWTEAFISSRTSPPPWSFLSISLCGCLIWMLPAAGRKSIESGRKSALPCSPARRSMTGSWVWRSESTPLAHICAKAKNTTAAHLLSPCRKCCITQKPGSTPSSALC